MWATGKEYPTAPPIALSPGNLGVLPCICARPRGLAMPTLWVSRVCLVHARGVKGGYLFQAILRFNGGVQGVGPLE